MASQSVDHATEDHIDSDLIPWADRDRTRTELVQIFCVKCLVATNGKRLICSGSRPGSNTS